MTMPQEHLATTVAEHGTGDASGPVRALLELGMRNKLREPDTREPGLHVSDAGKCPRQLFFRLTGVSKTEPMTLDSWMTLNLGKKAEELYLELLEAAGVRIIAQQTMTLEKDGEKVTGTLDLLLEIPEAVREIVPGLDPREVWELKTKNSRALGWVIKRGGPDGDDGYVKQLNGYLHGSTVKPTHARGRLVYTAVGATRGEPLFHAWFVDYDVEKVEADLARLAKIGKDAKAGIDPGIPEAFAKCPNWPCGYCDWKRLCFPRSK